MDSTTNRPNGALRSRGGGFKWFSDAELQEIKKGQCFRCHKKHGPDHVCQNKQFAVMLLEEDYWEMEGASKEDIEQLSKFKFRRVESNEKPTGNAQGPVGGIMTECQADSPIEHVLAEEDAECCICLSSYDDGVELRELPCGHHFHCACVDKWLYINATCPLCKYNILKSSNLGQEEV
ncbi:Zinc finger, RING-type [Sesbania bispinosa]|nr:Zinc finger, RING-type [Sesbania bispinosa]